MAMDQDSTIIIAAAAGGAGACLCIALLAFVIFRGRKPEQGSENQSNGDTSMQELAHAPKTEEFSSFGSQRDTQYAAFADSGAVDHYRPAPQAPYGTGTGGNADYAAAPHIAEQHYNI